MEPGDETGGPGRGVEFFSSGNLHDYMLINRCGT
jgi:hypothetical protein